MKRILAFLIAAVMLFSIAGAEALTSADATEKQLTLEDIRAFNGGTAEVYTENGRVTFVNGACTSAPVRSTEDAAAVAEAMVGLLGGDSLTRFEPWRTIHDPFGNVYHVFQQVYEDTVVLGGAVKVITNAEGTMLGLTGSVVSDLPDADPKESITAEQAEEAVLKHEADAGKTASQLVEGVTRKVVLPVERELDIEADEIQSRFVWSVYTTNRDASVAGLTDLPYLAHYVTLAGEYLYSLPTILPGDAAGNAGYNAEYVFEFMEPVNYTGYVDLSDGTEQEISIDLMRDTRTGMYYLGNIEHKIVVADCWEFLYNHGRVVLEHSADNREWDQVGLLSLYNYCRVYDYYKAIGWQGGDNDGTPIIVLKDFCDAEHSPIDNAAYVGKTCGWQSFLSSSINDFSQCLDVIAHEFTHCVTNTVMTYNAYMNDYGAINEAMSDIHGNICEMLMGATEDTTWLIGDRSTKAIRSMSDPRRYSQPAFTWDIYYAANVKDSTAANDHGGVHSNSSLLNNLAYLLYAEGGMTLEEMRAFWFAADCSMVPGSDFAQLKALLPWVLKNCGMERYQAAMDAAMAKTRLGEKEPPAELAERQSLVTLELPDNEVFNDGKWSLWLASIDIDRLKQVVEKLGADFESGELDGYPKLIRDEAQKMSEPEPENKGFLESAVEAVVGWFKGETEEEKAARLAREAEEAAAKDEMMEWIRSLIRDVFVFSNGSAGSDGHTIRMMSQRGRVFPFLMYLSVAANSNSIEQMNIVVYLNGRWIDATKLLAVPKDGEEKKASDGTEDELITEITNLVTSSTGVMDFLDKVFLNVPGGEGFELPGTGLEKVDLSANMAPEALETVQQNNNRMSRPKE